MLSACIDMKRFGLYIMALFLLSAFFSCGKKTEVVPFTADADSLVEARRQEVIQLQEENEKLTTALSREDSILARP